MVVEIPDVKITSVDSNVLNDGEQYAIRNFQRTAISPVVVFLKNILFFSQPDWCVEPDQNCTLSLVKNGKIGNTSCLIDNLNILGNINIL